MVAAGGDEGGGFGQVTSRGAAGPGVFGGRRAGYLHPSAFILQPSKEPGSVQQGVGEVESHAAQPAVLRVAAAGGQGEGFVEPLPRGVPLARQRVQPGAGEQGAATTSSPRSWEEMGKDIGAPPRTRLGVLRLTRSRLSAGKEG